MKILVVCTKAMGTVNRDESWERNLGGEISFHHSCTSHGVCQPGSH